MILIKRDEVYWQSGAIGRRIELSHAKRGRPKVGWEPAFSTKRCKPRIRVVRLREVATCEVCGSEFRRNSGRQACCSKSCACSKAGHVSRPPDGYSPPNKGKWTKPRPMSIGCCSVCGELLVNWTSQCLRVTCGRKQCRRQHALECANRLYAVKRKPCVVCGCAIERKSKRTCSKTCESIRRRESKRLSRRTCADLSLRKRLTVFERDQWMCQICGDVLVLWDWSLLWEGHRPPRNAPTIDHVIPVSKGGSNHLENLQAACYECNCLVKRDLLPGKYKIGGVRKPGGLFFR